MHKLTTVLFDGELHFATINEEPKRILDIGTGTGIWAIKIDRSATNLYQRSRPLVNQLTVTLRPLGDKFLNAEVWA